jgi:hypothetical protein
MCKAISDFVLVTLRLQPMMEILRMNYGQVRLVVSCQLNYLMNCLPPPGIRETASVIFTNFVSEWRQSRLMH